MTAASDRRPRGLGLGLKALISGSLLGVVLWEIDGARLWASARQASWLWLVAALAFYVAMVLVSAWRWDLLLRAQDVVLRLRTLSASWLVALFFNNFLPSNIGGDVARIADTTAAARSKTLATTVVLVDRGLGLLGLMLVAAAASTTYAWTGGGRPIVAPALVWLGLVVVTVGALAPLVAPDSVVGVLRPLRRVRPDWVDERLARLGGALGRFRSSPATLGLCLLGAAAVQAVLVGFYWAVARSMDIPVPLTQLAVIVPVSFLVQMVPVSINGLGVREAAFAFCFRRVGLPIEGGILLSFVGAALTMLVSLAGGLVYALRRPHPGLGA